MFFHELEFTQHWPYVTDDDWCGHHPDFPDWLESQAKTDIKRPCRECGRETGVVAMEVTRPGDESKRYRGQRVCDRGHNNGWEDVPRPHDERSTDGDFEDAAKNPLEHH